MEVSKEDLEQISTLSAAAYTPAQVCAALGFDKAEFDACMMDKESEISIAYFTGLNSAELAVRQSVLKLAISGSSPAQTLFMKLFDDTRKNIRICGFTEE